ncbi:MAG: hypothetical protein HY080_05990, partial [Gammaproteobacteria bacterium]|nr:hypothetical protein [Gammaproteobacteria bacterium]
EHAFASSHWLSQLPSGVQYADTVDQEVQAIMQGRRLDLPGEGLLQQGFLSDYGMTNMENDVNTYAEMLFTEPEKLMALATRYPRINAKYQLLTQFYQSLVPSGHSTRPCANASHER